jgi:hypothetical protein
MYLGNRRCCINNIVNNVAGPQGAQGPYGTIGEIGITGVTGPDGLQGVTGLCYRGLKGAVGYKGPQGGLTGDAGPPGPNGESGPYNSSKNLHFNFTINSDQSYSNSFIELTNLATVPVSNTISLTSGNYVIQYQLSENWNDTNSRIYIEFYDTNATYPYVFNPTNLSYLVLTTNGTTNGTNLFGTGNDFVNLLSSTSYAVRLYQSNASGTTVQIGGKKVYFSITFTEIS